MNRKIKSLMVSSLALALLATGSAVSANASQTKYMTASQPVVETASKKAGKYLSYYSRGYTTGKDDSYHFYHDYDGDLALNYPGDNSITNISPYVTMSLISHHAPLYNVKYGNGYINGYNKYAYQTRHYRKSHKPFTYAKKYGHALNQKIYAQAIREAKFIKRQPNAKAYYAGFVYAQMGTTKPMDFDDDDHGGQSYIPSQYRNSVTFAKGDLLGNLSEIHNINQMDSRLFSEQQYSDYLGDKGNVSYKELLKPHYRYLYDLYWKVTEHDEHNAATVSQGKSYARYISRKYHLSKNDVNFMNEMYENDTEEEIAEGDDGSFGTGQYIWNNVGFASNLIKKAPFYYPVYYTPHIINFAGNLGKGKQAKLSGYIIGTKAGNTKAARKTALAFRQYETNWYHLHHNKNIIKNFKKHYEIVPEVRGKIVTGHKIYHSVGVSIYYIHNRHVKDSTVVFIMPTDRGPLSFTPQPEG